MDPAALPDTCIKYLFNTHTATVRWENTPYVTDVKPEMQRNLEILPRLYQ